MAEAAQASRVLLAVSSLIPIRSSFFKFRGPAMSTTAMFYLMPLGHADILHSGKLCWDVFCALPARVSALRVNDIVDAETDSLNPRKGTFMFGSRGAREQLAAFEMADRRGSNPIRDRVLFFVGRAFCGERLLLLAVDSTMLQASDGKAPSVRRAHSGELPARLRVEQLAEQRCATALADFLFGALFAMHSHIFGEVMDIEPDRLSGRRTTATLIGESGAPNS